MNVKLFAAIIILNIVGAALLTLPAAAQDVGRVSPAALPLPLPNSEPVAPKVLRAGNPWNLPMTGEWKFALTHGRVKAGRFEQDPAARAGITASTSQDGHSPEDAFDGTNDTRWCASDSSFPQWLQTDLCRNETVKGIKLAWENGGGDTNAASKARKRAGIG